MSETQPPQRRRKSSLRSRLSWAAVIMVGVLGLTAGVLALIKVPYAVQRPGPVTNALGNVPDGDHPIITVPEQKGVTVYQPGSGELYFTTVSVQGGPVHPLTALGYLWAKLDPDAVIKPVEDVFPNNPSAEQVKKQDTAMMAQSQDGAHIVAARAAGFPVTETLGVAGVMESSVNKDALHPADDLLRFDGTPIKTADDLQAALEKAPVGTSIPVRVRRDGKELDVKVRLVEKDGRKVMGILVRPQYQTPLQVRFDAGSVGGPSAGLMFSLALYDKLTPGDLTGGKHIAGTGTITGAGAVGPIGGIEFKMRGARDAGADFFLAPEANCENVKGHEVDGLRVVPVSTFDDAKGYVERIAKGEVDDLPRCG